MSGTLNRRRVGRCPSGCAILAYSLPVRLDESILPFIQHLGKQIVPFVTVLKMSCPGFTVTGIKRLKEIRIALGKDISEEDIKPFEEALTKWLESNGVC
jgi:hypothetical protein